MNVYLNESKQSCRNFTTNKRIEPIQSYLHVLSGVANFFFLIHIIVKTCGLTELGCTLSCFAMLQ